MTKTKKIGLHLDTDAIALLAELAPNENRKGQYISQLLREAAARRTVSIPSADGAGERTALHAELARLAEELARIAQVAAQMAQITERLAALEREAHKAHH